MPEDTTTTPTEPGCPVTFAPVALGEPATRFNQRFNQQFNQRFSYRSNQRFHPRFKCAQLQGEAR